LNGLTSNQLQLHAQKHINHLLCPYIKARLPYGLERKKENEAQRELDSEVRQICYLVYFGELLPSPKSLWTYMLTGRKHDHNFAHNSM
jgi:hypothetical protein